MGRARARRSSRARPRRQEAALLHAHAGGTLRLRLRVEVAARAPGGSPRDRPEALDAYLTLRLRAGPAHASSGISTSCRRVTTCTFADGPRRGRASTGISATSPTSRRAVEEDDVEQLRALLDEAVRDAADSDVPLGAFLSGGVDSSAVVGLMARAHRPARSRPSPSASTRTAYNELKYARIAAKHFGTEHHEFIVTPDVCRDRR